MNRVLHRIAAAAAQRQHAELGIDLFEVGYGRHDAVFQDLDRNDVLDAHTHRMPGEALGIGHHDFAGGITEGVAQGHDFSRGTAAAGRGVGLVRNEDGLRSHRAPVDAVAALGGGHQVVHDHRDVLDVQACGVEGTVAGFGAEHLDDAAHAALAHPVFTLHDQGAGTHPQQHAVAAAIEGQGCFFDLVVGGGCPGGQEAGTDPLHEVVAGDVITAQDDDAAAATIADPILGQGHALGRAGTGRVDVRVGAAGADVFGKLAVSHGQDAEEETPVEGVGLAGQDVAHLADAAVDFELDAGFAGVAAQVFQQLQAVFAVLPDEVALELVGHAVAAGEGTGEDDAGFVAQRFGQQPAVGQVFAGGRWPPGLHQRNAGLAQGVDAGGHGELGCDVQRLHQLLGHAVLFAQVEGAAARGQLDDVGRVGDGLEAAAAIGRFDDAGDVFVRNRAPEALGDQVDELLTTQDAHRVVGIHQAFAGAGQTQAGTGDDDGPLGWVVAIVDFRGSGRRGRGGHLLQHLGKHLAHGSKGLGGNRRRTWHKHFLFARRR